MLGVESYSALTDMPRPSKSSAGRCNGTSTAPRAPVEGAANQGHAPLFPSSNNASFVVWTFDCSHQHMEWKVPFGTFLLYISITIGRDVMLNEGVSILKLTFSNYYHCIVQYSQPSNKPKARRE